MNDKIKGLAKRYKTNPGWYWLLATLFLFPILPEYLSLIFLLVSFVVFKKNWGKLGNKAKLGDIGKILFIYMGYMVISAIWSKTHVLSGLIGMMWLGCFLIYVFIANSVNTRLKLKNAITLVNISAGIIGAIAILEVVTYNLTRHFGWDHFIVPNPFYYYFNNYIYSLIPVSIINDKFVTRASATFDNPLILATYLVTTIPFCTFGSVYFKHSINRKISRLCLLLAIGGIISTSSRGAYLAAIFAIIAMITGASTKQMFKKVFPFVVILMVTVPFGLFLRYKNTPAGDFSASNQNRFEIWLSSLDMFVHHPILGLGAGTDNVHTLLEQTYNLPKKPHATSLYLELLAEGGIIGAVLFFTTIYFVIKTIIKTFKTNNKTDRTYNFLYISSLLGFLVISMFEFTLQSPKEIMMLFTLLGFVEATHRISTHQEQLSDGEIISYTEVKEDKIKA